MGSIDAGRITDAYRENFCSTRQIRNLRKIFFIFLDAYTRRLFKNATRVVSIGDRAPHERRARNTRARIPLCTRVRPPPPPLLKISIRDFHSNERSAYTCRPRPVGRLQFHANRRDIIAGRKRETGSSPTTAWRNCTVYYERHARDRTWMEEPVIKIPSSRGQRNVPVDVSFNLVREAPSERATKYIAVIPDFHRSCS